MGNRGQNWNGKSRGGAFGHRFFVILIRKLGIRSAYAFLSIVVIYFIPFAPKATKSVWDYNRKILHYGWFKSLIYLYVHYYRFGQTLIDKIAINNHLHTRYRFEFENYEEFIDILNRGAAIMVGAHVGCWQAGAHFFGSYAEKLHVIMYDAEYQKIKDIVSRTANYTIIPIVGEGLDTLFKIKEVVDRQEYICIQGDRYMHGDKTFEVNFMGEKAFFPQGPFMLAAKFSLPTVFYFAMREEKMSYRFIFVTLKAGGSAKDILYRYTDALEKVLKCYPQQWFNFYNVWH